MTARRGRPPGKSAEVAARDALLMARYRAGERLVDLATSFGITPGRVGQIIAASERRPGKPCCHFNPEAGAYC